MSSKKKKLQLKLQKASSFSLLKMYYLNSNCFKCIPLLKYLLQIWNGMFSIYNSVVTNWCSYLFVSMFMALKVIIAYFFRGIKIQLVQKNWLLQVLFYQEKIKMIYRNSILMMSLVIDFSKTYFTNSN